MSPVVGTPRGMSATTDSPHASACSTPPFEIVIVSYRSRQQCEGLLRALPSELPIAIADNSGNCDQIRELTAQRARGRYLDAGGVGFARAANLAARTSTYEYVVFVNPDSRPTLQDLRTLVRDVAKDPLCASSAALSVDEAGRAELGVGGWEPSVRRTLVHAVGLHKVVPQAGLFARPAWGSEARVDWTTGACLAVRLTTFLELGGFDERYYVYNEDMAFGRQVRTRGLHQRLRTDVPVRHTAGGSGAPSREMSRLRGASMAGYVRLHNGRAASGTIALALALGSLARAMAAAVRSRPQTAAGFLEYAKGVLTGQATVAGRPITTGR